MKWLIILQDNKFQQQKSSQVKRRIVMKKSIGAISLALVLTMVLLSGCASASTPTRPTITLSPVSPTFTPEATATQIPSPTAVIPVWKEIINIDSPYEYSASDAFYHRERIPSGNIIFNTDTRWTVKVQVDKLTNDIGEASTGIVLLGYTESGNTPSFVFVYQHGFWSIGYAPINDFTYWQTFENLTDPVQFFELSISHNGRELSIQNNRGFTFNDKMPENSILFADSPVILLNAQIGPRTKIALSNLVIQQLIDPSAPAVANTSLAEPYTTSFENLDISNSTETLPFRFPNTLDWVSFFTRDIHLPTLSKNENYTLWTVDSRAHTGKYAINVVPGGNPVTKDDTLPISVAVLDPVFNVSGYETVNLKIWINTTSNPRVASVHNCDSDLQIYYKTDLIAPWVDYVVMCGENVKESQGWHEVSLDLDVKGKSTIQFAFGYEVQNISKPDPTIYYLIDDIEITAK